MLDACAFTRVELTMLLPLFVDEEVEVWYLSEHLV